MTESSNSFLGRLGGSGSGRNLLISVLGILLVFIVVLGIYWSAEPAAFDIKENTRSKLAGLSNEQVVGSASTAALIRVTETLLDKPGGYLSNDVMPPGLYLDNIPNWEYGVLIQVRDLSRALRENFSRSQSQSTEDPDLILAEPNFSVDSESWLFPQPESEYREAIGFIESYLARIASPGSGTQFYARADNLSTWLLNVESRLGSFSQRLSASVGQARINTDTSGDPAAAQSTPAQSEMIVRTPWLQIDDVFYEARGATWALLHFLKAVEVDFRSVLEDKNAVASFRQIIRELEASQRTVFFPVILNGSGFGVFANHSLTMANYISRANAAIIDLRNLLAQG
ncbi:MAG: DUF2333 family protein [Pseudomonadales bacterium]|nr:DUF2333 family protein [Pseudomonadales bacterium]